MLVVFILNANWRLSVAWVSLSTILLFSYFFFFVFFFTFQHVRPVATATSANWSAHVARMETATNRPACVAVCQGTQGQAAQSVSMLTERRACFRELFVTTTNVVFQLLIVCRAWDSIMFGICFSDGCCCHSGSVEHFLSCFKRLIRQSVRARVSQWQESARWMASMTRGHMCVGGGGGGVRTHACLTCFFMCFCVFVLSECTSGTYGQDCAKKCTCQHGGTCDFRTGACVCPSGWNGTSCEKGTLSVVSLPRPPFSCLHSSRIHQSWPHRASPVHVHLKYNSQCWLAWLCSYSQTLTSAKSWVAVARSVPTHQDRMSVHVYQRTLWREMAGAVEHQVSNLMFSRCVQKALKNALKNLAMVVNCFSIKESAHHKHVGQCD